MKIPTLTPTDFVAIANQTLEYAFGIAHIEGELANFRVSKGKWVYFDLKDDLAKVSCFASVYALPGPLKDGMMVKISGTPRLHPQFGFSVTVQTIQPSGEGSIKKAFELLKAKLTAEGLFEESRKRFLPYPPKRIALVASRESAAYADFMKILGIRWPYLVVDVYDTQVQGEKAPVQLATAIGAANGDSVADILVVTRGGGSADDLAAFNDERVVRAIAASRIPTMVAIGHEIDESLSELAADLRASTPSNAAELIAPDRAAELRSVRNLRSQLLGIAGNALAQESQNIKQTRELLLRHLNSIQNDANSQLKYISNLLKAYNPEAVLNRGYALVRSNGKIVKTAADVVVGDTLNIDVSKAAITATINSVSSKLSEE